MEILSFFESYGLPAVIIGVLFTILWYKIKESDNQQAKLYEALQQAQIKMQETLCGVIKEESAVIAGNTTAFNNLSITIADISSNQTKIAGLLERMLERLINADTQRTKQPA